MGLTEPVRDYLTCNLRTLQSRVLDKLALQLTDDEGMSLLSTPQEREAIKLIKPILEYAEGDTFGRYRSRNVSISVLHGNMPLTLSIEEQSSHWHFILPNQEIADARFARCRGEVKDRVISQLDDWIAALTPWASMRHSIAVLDRYGASTEQMCFYLPWLPRVVDRLMDGEDPYQRAVGSRGDRGIHARCLKALHKPSKCDAYMSFTKAERDFFRQGDAALATLALLEDTPSATRTGFSVSLSKAGQIATPFDVNIVTDLT